MLKRICVYSKVAKVLALRELLERALFRSDNVLFGATGNVHHDGNEKNLLKQNKNIVRTDFLQTYFFLYLNMINNKL